jgi:hypothetical protein
MVVSRMGCVGDFAIFILRLRKILEAELPGIGVKAMRWALIPNSSFAGRRIATPLPQAPVSLPCGRDLRSLLNESISLSMGDWAGKQFAKSTSEIYFIRSDQ